MSDLGSVFTRIYAGDTWGNGSGPGSDPANVRAYLDYLQDFLRRHQIRSIVDCGCGDWQLMRTIDLTGIDYLGIDYVDSVVERNRREFGAPNLRFAQGDFTSMTLPEADLVICKDALQHLPSRKSHAFLRQLPGFRFALLTNDEGDNEGRDLRLTGQHHYAPLDLRKPPFDLAAREVCRTLGNKSTLLALGGRASEADALSVGLPRTVAAIRGTESPRILLAILAKQKEAVLPLYLRCIEALDYPKDRIVLHVRTNNNTDATERLLGEWLERVGSQYAAVEYDASDVSDRVEQFGVHEWNPTRFRVLARLRQTSLLRTLQHDCDFYFVVDVDNFLRPRTLRDLVQLNLPIVGPFLRHEDERRLYSNYHHRCDERGYYLADEEYGWIWSRKVRGVIEVDVIHCTYLVRRDVIPSLAYDDGSGRHEYVIFSESARRAGVAQFLDNREIYGYLSLDESSETSAALLADEVP